MQNHHYLYAADAILILHVLFVAFVVLGLAAIFIGRAKCWPWVRNPWFRMIHLLGIGYVVIQSWFGIMCPLTVWEKALRAKAGAVVYTGDFIEHWLSKLLFFEAPLWVFATVYTLFGAAVLGSWFWVRPRAFGAAPSAERDPNP